MKVAVFGAGTMGSGIAQVFAAKGHTALMYASSVASAQKHKDKLAASLQKRVEKGQKTAADTLDAVARSLPALMRAEKIQDKARKAGFDWDSVGPALDKLSEEAEELKSAVRDGTNPEEELGDLLFAAVKVGRFLGLDSELALHAACEKFIRRFRLVEKRSDKPLPQQDLSSLEALWRQAKMEESDPTVT